MDTTAKHNKPSLSAFNAAQQQLLSRVEDCIRFANEKNCVKFVGFLDEKEQAVVKCANVGGRCTIYPFGGYEGAERVVLGFYPNGGEVDVTDFPVAAVTVRPRKGIALTHRDVLGSVLALGIERDCVGDILSETGRSVLFVKDSVARFVLQQLDRVGREGVTCEQGCQPPLPAAHSFLPFHDTVASSRLDAVVASVCRFSRAHACEMIEAGLVTVNGAVVQKLTKGVIGGDILTVRGHGKYAIDSIDAKTKKGRLVLQARKYQ